MSWITDVFPWLCAMAVLILFSALFSGSEAALFSLDSRSRRGLERAGIGGRIAARLLAEPERLLAAILFWNLLINMTYFALPRSSAVAWNRIHRRAVRWLSHSLR